MCELWPNVVSELIREVAMMGDYLSHNLQYPFSEFWEKDTRELFGGDMLLKLLLSSSWHYKNDVLLLHQYNYQISDQFKI